MILYEAYFGLRHAFSRFSSNGTKTTQIKICLLNSGRLEHAKSLRGIVASLYCELSSNQGNISVIKKTKFPVAVVHTLLICL